MPDLTTLYGGYDRASRYSAVPRRTLKKALKPYGIRLSMLRGRSDAALRHLAARKVLRKHDVDFTLPGKGRRSGEPVRPQPVSPRKRRARVPRNVNPYVSPTPRSGPGLRLF